MTHGHTAESLIAFRDKVAAAFAAKEIRSPVHFPGGNEQDLIGVFSYIQPEDVVFSTWRSMYHALLKGIPEAWIWNELRAGRSMYLINREYRFYSSSIVGGTLPIAAGVAMALKRSGSPGRVNVFVGDMGASIGLFQEFCQYAAGHRLPVRVIVENNKYSTNACTAETWGRPGGRISVLRYAYERTMPHVGLEQKVVF